MTKNHEAFTKSLIYRTAVTSLSLKDIPLNDTVLLWNIFLGKPRPVVLRNGLPKFFKQSTFCHLLTCTLFGELWLIVLFGTASRKALDDGARNVTTANHLKLIVKSSATYSQAPIIMPF